MTDSVNPEWDLWQAAWRSDAAAPVALGQAPTSAPTAAPAVAAASLAAEMQRRLVRARRLAWLMISADIAAAIPFVMFGVFALTHSPTLPIAVWAVSLFGFTAVALGFAIWNRRDALTFSAAATTDFAAALRLRLARRERVPRFIAWFVASEIAVGLGIYAVWYPGSLGRAVRLCALVAVVMTASLWRSRNRLRRERAQLEALVGELAALGGEASD